MMGLTHLVFSLFIGSFFLSYPWALLLAVLGGLFPDFDIGTSLLGRYIRPFSSWLKHRAFFHSLPAGVFFTVIISFFFGSSSLIFLLSYIGHLFLDSLTQGGVPFFFPSKIRLKGPFKSGSLFDYLLLFIFLFLLVMNYFVISSEDCSFSGKTVILGFDTELVDYNAINSTLLILEKHNISATFFVMGDLAERNPEIIRLIASRHEVASHTMSHPNLLFVNDSFLFNEIIGSKVLLENITGFSVFGFRAPYNLIDQKGFDVVSRAGYNYDSSAFGYLSFLYPRPSVTELWIGNFGPFPLEDYFFCHTLHLGGLGFRMMSLASLSNDVLILDLHPRFIAAHPSDFDAMISSFEEKGYSFMTYNDFNLRYKVKLTHCRSATSLSD